MNQTKLVITDLDGTLLNNQKQVSSYTVEAIQELTKKGILFGVASGRSVESILELSRQWRIRDALSFVIGMNGGVFYDVHQNKKEEYYTIDGTSVLEIIETYKDMDVYFWVLEGSTRYTNRSTEWSRQNGYLYNEIEKEVDMMEFLPDRKMNKFMISCKEEDMDEMKRRAMHLNNENYVGFSTASNLFEFVHPANNKGHCLKKACDHFHIGLESVVAFGDELNDLEMLKKAGVGICVKNGLDKVKEQADFISPYTNEEDALAHYIYESVLKEEN